MPGPSTANGTPCMLGTSVECGGRSTGPSGGGLDPPPAWGEGASGGATACTTMPEGSGPTFKAGWGSTVPKAPAEPTLSRTMLVPPTVVLRKGALGTGLWRGLGADPGGRARDAPGRGTYTVPLDPSAMGEGGGQPHDARGRGGGGAVGGGPRQTPPGGEPLTPSTAL